MPLQVDKFGRIEQFGYRFNPDSSSPYVSVKPNYICTYLKHLSRSTKPTDAFITDELGFKIRIICEVCNCPLSSSEVHNKQTKCNSCINLGNNKARPDLSHKARHRLMTAFDWLLLFSKNKKAYNEKLKSWYQFRIAMLTIKLPCKQLHDDNYIKSKLLNNFLTIMRTQYHMNFYIWRAEKGMDEILHFHIVHDCYIDYKEVNRIWCKILNNHGYIEKYRHNQQNKHKDGFKIDILKLPRWSKSAQLKAYKKGIATNWTQPSGVTDIHSLRKVRNARAYLAKYMSKENCTKLKIEQYENKYKEENNCNSIPSGMHKAITDAAAAAVSVYGHIWFISQPLSKLKSISMEISTSIDDSLQKLFDCHRWKVIKKDYCTIFAIDIRSLLAELLPPFEAMIRNFFTGIREKFKPQEETIFSALGIPLQIF